MDHNFWHERWASKRTCFHQDGVNLHLESHWHRLGLATDSRILVPLCGKSLDMIWLREQGHRVAGIEISQLAVEAFFSETGLTPSIRQGHGYSCWSADGIDLFCGDFFKLHAAELGRIDGCYDRAALVALPGEMRSSYAGALLELLPSLAPVLLVTLEYDPAEMDGPPFAVTLDEVRRLFGARCAIEHLQSFNALEANPNLTGRGLGALTEHICKLVRD
jgi:thiopurine S-methyltransferase